MLQHKWKLIHFILDNFQQDESYWNSVFEIVKDNWSFDYALNSDSIKQCIWDTYVFILKLDNGEFRDQFHDYYSRFIDVAEILLECFLVRPRSEDAATPRPMSLLTLESLNFLACQKEKNCFRETKVNPQHYRQLMNQLLLQELGSSSIEFDDFMKFLLQNSSEIMPLLQNPVHLALRVLSTDVSKMKFQSQVLVASVIFDLILFHRLEFLGGDVPEIETCGEESLGSQVSDIVERFYNLFQPRLFSSASRDSFLARLQLLTRVLSPKHCLLFFKKALRIAVIVQAHSALWLLGFAKSLFLRFPSFLAPAIHINPSLSSHFTRTASDLESSRHLYQFHLSKPEKKNLPVIDCVQEVGHYSVHELSMLLRHHDKYVRTSAQDFMDRILLETSMLNAQTELDKSLDLGLFQNASKSMNSLLARCAALHLPS
eukprot:Gregarina_sp_Poly_1__1152@NODE_1280_length_4510_cov_54_898267_g867_i0_p1_GENE_NODE_1280_length_4510_cov_54_898267_g867_i0NODE_1280_length_4510_cov_54_898267_g867_i0_p1_ORF_typecomplete_len429_score56_44CBF/PF03914_17/4_4e03CBF/PF03914_17/6_6e08_NODE_1280_length_4510_cov_54_898267_g867_i010672353